MNGICEIVIPAKAVVVLANPGSKLLWKA